MPSHIVHGPVGGNPVSWRTRFPELAGKVTRVTSPLNRGITWEGSSVWAYKERPRNIGALLEENIRLFPEREAYVFYPSGVRLTWRETGQRVHKIAHSLLYQYGLKKGDRLGLMIPGTVEYVLTYLSCVMLGVIVVPVNMGISPEGVAHQINKVSLKALVINADTYRDKLAPVASSLTNIPIIFYTDEIAKESGDSGVRFTLLETGSDSLSVPIELDEWDPCAISFTSGTTGTPKGTIAMHFNASGCAQTAVEILKGLDESDINICLPPLYHNTAVYTNFLPALLTGGKMVITEQFEPDTALRLIKDERVTWCVAAPIMLWMMMQSRLFSPDGYKTLRKFAFGGHAASGTFIHQLKNAFSPIAMVNAGSVSESTAMGFALPTEDALDKLASCGLATLNTEIAIFDEEGQEISTPEIIGEVGYKGQQTNAGYWDEPEQTHKVFRRDGYVLSGDWAKFDQDGYLWLLDRKKDMIVRGGQNVYCIEVENQLYLNDKVLRAAVVGVPDHVFSERVKAVIVLKPGQTLSAQEVREFCLERLASYESPEYVVFAKKIPTNPAGKTIKTDLVEFWGDDELDSVLKAKDLLRMYLSALPESLVNRGMFWVGHELISPLDAAVMLEGESSAGDELAAIIVREGIVALLRPDEARFRT